MFPEVMNVYKLQMAAQGAFCLITIIIIFIFSVSSLESLFFPI